MNQPLRYHGPPRTSYIRVELHYLYNSTCTVLVQYLYDITASVTKKEQKKEASAFFSTGPLFIRSLHHSQARVSPTWRLESCPPSGTPRQEMSAAATALVRQTPPVVCTLCTPKTITASPRNWYDNKQHAHCTCVVPYREHTVQPNRTTVAQPTNPPSMRLIRCGTRNKYTL